MKKKKWICLICIVAFLCAGGIWAVSMVSPETKDKISPEISYIELCTAMDLDGTYKSMEFSANQDEQVNIWFENQGVEAVNIELVKKEGLLKKELYHQIWQTEVILRLRLKKEKHILLSLIQSLEIQSVVD